jgi:hypothetical protein
MRRGVTGLLLVIMLVVLALPVSVYASNGWGSLAGLPAYFFLDVCKDGARFQFIHTGSTGSYKIAARLTDTTGSLDGAFISQRQPVSLLNVDPFPNPANTSGTEVIDRNGFTTVAWDAPQAVGTNIKFLFYFGNSDTSADIEPRDVVTNCMLSDSVLDRFNRDSATLGASWSGATSSAHLADWQLQVSGTGPLYWQTDVLSTTQEASVVLNSLSAGGEHGLLLKVQGATPDYHSGAIKAVYDATKQEVRIETFEPGGTQWVERLKKTGVQFQNGDRLSAAVLEDQFDSDPASIGVLVARTPKGSTEPVLLGVVNTKYNDLTVPQQDLSFFKGKGGRIGLWFANVNNAKVDYFARAVNPPNIPDPPRQTFLPLMQR